MKEFLGLYLVYFLRRSGIDFGLAFSLLSLLIHLLPSSIWQKAKLHLTEEKSTVCINCGRAAIPAEVT